MNSDNVLVLAEMVTDFLLSLSEEEIEQKGLNDEGNTVFEFDDEDWEALAQTVSFFSFLSPFVSSYLDLSRTLADPLSSFPLCHACFPLCFLNFRHPENQPIGGSLITMTRMSVL